jgi:hypothetical protein
MVIGANLMFRFCVPNPDEDDDGVRDQVSACMYVFVCVYVACREHQFTQ